jgi:hypothetical protein
MTKFGISFIFAAMVFGSGCDAGNINPNDCDPYGKYACWVPPAQPLTGIVPTAGYFKATPAVSGTDLGSLNDWGFSVISDSDGSGELFVQFSSDGYRYDRIPIVGGAFRYAHGGGRDYSDCPTDGYIISGHFTSSDLSAGFYRDMDCDVSGKGGDFVASLNK